MDNDKDNEKWLFLQLLGTIMETTQVRIINDRGETCHNDPISLDRMVKVDLENADDSFSFIEWCSIFQQPHMEKLDRFFMQGERVCGVRILGTVLAPLHYARNYFPRELIQGIATQKCAFVCGNKLFAIKKAATTMSICCSTSKMSFSIDWPDDSSQVVERESENLSSNWWNIRMEIAQNTLSGKFTPIGTEDTIETIIKQYYGKDTRKYTIHKSSDDVTPHIVAATLTTSPFTDDPKDIHPLEWSNENLQIPD